MERSVELIASLVTGIAWLAGIALAHGFASTAAAVFFPPYAWYLVVKSALLAAGWIGV